MKLSRRRLFELALGATQVGLLSSFAPRRARAQAMGDGPTKMLAIHIIGGLHFESFFAPLTRAGIVKYIPGPAGGNYPWGYFPAQVENFDRTPADLDSPGPVRKIRGPIYWDWNNSSERRAPNPASRGAQTYRPHGYSWADPTYKIYEKIALLVGADQNTASHQSGVVASMCGVAGANFGSPAVQAVVANVMASRFPDRPIPNVSLGGTLPLALGLPALASPSFITSPNAVEPNLSDRRDGAWRGLRTRRDVPELNYDGTPTGRTIPATIVDEAIFSAVRKERRGLNRGSDALLEKLYDTYKGASKTISRDVLTVLERAVGWEHITQNPRYPSNLIACTGEADACGPISSMGPYDFALRLLKSDMVSCVTMQATSINNISFDTHTSNGPQIHSNTLHIALDAVGQLLIEMSLTPAPSGGGRTLLDETQVYVFSDFGRTFPKHGSDHHPATCAILAGGKVRGNQMIGGYDETAEASPMGLPVPMIEEGGDRTMRAARAQDVAATVLHGYGLEAGTDFFIPGGYGVFDGAIG